MKTITQSERDRHGRDEEPALLPSRPTSNVDRLLEEAETLRGYVARRMWGYPSDVDDVLQTARVQLWRVAGAYDPKRGTLGAFARVVVANVVTSELRRLSRRPSVAQLHERDAVTIADPLAGLVDSFARHRWMRRAADHTSDIEWEVFVALVRSDGDMNAAAERADVPVRTARAARDRVRVLVRTALAAYAMSDEGDGRCVSACIPDVGGLRETLVYLDSPTVEASQKLRIVPGVFRTRRALARRALALAEQILDAPFTAG